MKVIINFGDVRVTVPCGDGDMVVRDVMRLAIERYKKATVKPHNAWIVVHNLKTCTDGGILDPDDRLSDVADDREQIIATFEERNSMSNYFPHQNGINLDRTSTGTESIGTESPDVFTNDNNSSYNNNPNINPAADINRNNIANIKLECNDVEITSDQISSGISVPLQVRRGSEPALNRLSPDVSTEPDPTKRWSTAVAVDSRNNRNASSNSLNDPYHRDHSDDEKEKSRNSNSLSPRSIKEEGYGSEEKSEHTPSSTTSSNTFSRFSRGSGRLSMLANNLEVWAEAADRQLLRVAKDEHSDETNKNVISTPSSSKHSNYDREESSSVSSEDTRHLNNNDSKSVIITLKNEAGPLGIHIYPEYGERKGGNGLVIQGIEPDSRVDRDGRMHVRDVITEINGQNIQHMHFETAHEVFKSALLTPEIVLRVIKSNNNDAALSTIPITKRPLPPPPVLPKPTNIKNYYHEQLVPYLESGMVEGEERTGGQMTKIATVTPTKKLSGQTPRGGNALVVANTRKIGKKYHIPLRKGSDGLGFSITTRDNPTGGHCPIYIKTILSKGAAVEDGRLRPGDRLLECCGIEMTGKTQNEAVAIFKTIPYSTTVDLIISRQEPDTSPSPMMPRQLPPEIAAESSGPWNEREVLTFEIPLNDTGSAGLGVSVKGKTSTANGMQSDLGIFVKSVIHGGAASKDGRLRTNDQLVNINGIPLLGMTNSQAMETLRRAMMQIEGPIANPNAITLTVARRIPSPHPFNANNHQRNDSLISATSVDSYNDDNLIQSPINNDISNKMDETPDSFKSNENTVIYKPRSESVNPDKHISDSHASVSTVTYKKDYQSNDNADCSDVHSHYGRTVISRGDILIEHDHDIESATRMQSRDKVQSDVTDSQTGEDDAGFQRDGFGRQSMSEKRHAQLDARNTDTYQRNKKAKEEKERQKQLHRENEASETELNRVHDDNNQSRDVPPHDQNYAYTVTPKGQIPIPLIQRCNSDELSLTVLYYCNPQNNLNERKCQSPGSCPYHSTQNGKKETGPSLGMRKSSSLESLQTMMQDLQKEQIEQTVGVFTGPRHATVRVARSRETNESFRAAVDRSITPNIDNAAPLETMETVAEEESESGSSLGQHHHHSNIPISHRPSGAVSLSSTQATGTATATNSHMTTDDETTLFKKKNSGKKKGLFKTLFKFGSKKGRSSPTKGISDKEKSEPMRDKDTVQPTNAHIYIQEHERIQEQYRKLVEQQRHHTQVVPPLVHSSAQPTPPLRRTKPIISPKGSAPLHSTPTGPSPGPSAMSNDQIARHERMQQLRAQHQRLHAERQGQYPNDQEDIGYSHEAARNQRREYDYSHTYNPYIYSSPLTSNVQERRVVLPKGQFSYNDIVTDRNYPVSHVKRSVSLRCPNVHKKRHGTEIIHSRGNSYDFYRQAMESPGSRVGIADHNKYSHYMNYREIQQHLKQYNQQQQPMHHYRQMSAAPMIRGERQMPSPKTHHERPVSNHFEYDSVSAINTAILNQQQQQQSLQQQKMAVTRNDASYSSLPRKGERSLSVDRQRNIARQPIYNTNPLKIYGRIHPNGYNNTNNAIPHYYDSIPPVHGNNSHYQSMASKYQSVRSGSKV